MNKKEQSRLIVLNRVERGMMTAREAAQILGLSLRQVKRILAAYRKDSAAALAHGNRGAKPPNALDDGVKRRVLEPARVTYAGCNTQHFILTSRDFWQNGRAFLFPQFYRGASDLDSNIARRVGEAMVKSSKDSYGKC